MEIEAYIRDHLQDGFDLVDGLLNESGQLSRELPVCLDLLALLDFLFGFLWFFDGFRLRLRLRLRDVFEKSDVADNRTLLVFNVTVVIDFLASTLLDVTICQFGNDIAVLIHHVTLLVDFTSQSRVLGDLLFFFFPSLSLTKKIPVHIKNITITVDRFAKQHHSIALNEATDDCTLGVRDLAVFCNSRVVEAGKRACLLAFALSFRDEPRRSGSQKLPNSESLRYKQSDSCLVGRCLGTEYMTVDLI